MCKVSLRAACLLAVLLLNLLFISPSPQADGLNPSRIVKDKRNKILFDDSHASGVFVRKVVGNQIVCREATLEEARALTERDQNAPLREIAAPDSVSVQQTGLKIMLRGTSQLKGFPQAEAAFMRAAARWEALISTPITIIIDVDFGPRIFGEKFDEDTLGGTFSQVLKSDDIYPAVRSSLVAGASSLPESTLYATLPTGTVPTDLGSTQGVAAPSAVFRALGLIEPVADPEGEEEDFGDPPAIGFNSNFDFDFDPANGIDTNKIDFDATAVHEIGHALGFISLVGERELDSSFSVTLSVLDLFRFRPGIGAGTFQTAPRILSSGGDQRFFAGASNVSFSTGRPDNTGGDGEQASHWKDASFIGQYLGIMDPTAEFGERQVITDNDVAAVDAMGYRITGSTLPPPPPPGDVINVESGEPATGSISAPPADGGVLGQTQYAIEVPAGATQLTVDLNGNQDVDLFLRFGQAIQIVNDAPVADHVSDSLENFESITVTLASTPPLREGTYFIAIGNFGPGAASFTLNATVTDGSGGGGSAPTIANVQGNLVGDNLGLIFSAGDADGDFALAQVSLLDGSNSVIGQPRVFPVNFGNQTQVAAQLVINNMSASPTALRARLVFIDAAGHRSAGATADFSQAQPGGVTISSSSFNGKKMTLRLQGTVGTLELEVNGLIVAPPRKIKANSSGSKLTIKGSATQLNVRSGFNRVRVKNGSAWSNISLMDN